MKSEAYRAAGVDIDAGNKAVDLMRGYVKSTWGNEVLSDIGGFGGLFALDTGKYASPVLVAGTDGVGTKLKIAFMADKHDTVGIDAVAISVLHVLGHLQAVVGDRRGKVGVGLGKASDVQSAVRKATNYAKKHLITIPLVDNRTIPHSITIKWGAARVMLKPAPEGTGIIAGGAVRVVVEAAGIADVVSKILGTSNQASNVYATLAALGKLKEVRKEKSEKKEKK